LGARLATPSEGDPGDRAEFERLIMEHLGSLQAFARRLTRDGNEAEDIVQESCLRAWRFFDKFQQGTNFKAWVFRILKNTFINMYRKKKAQPVQVDFDKVEGTYETLLDDTRVTRLESPEEALEGALVMEDVERGLCEMPEEYRMVVSCCLVEGFTYRETADALDVPIGTVMSRLHRGRRFLQARLLIHARERGLVGPELPETHHVEENHE
jgi:RNA polymerase sigma-70 factor (ECF subfamily)